MNLIQKVENRILMIRGEKVMMDADLARLYGVSAKSLKQAVRRNQERFPADFMFELTWEETRTALRSQIVTLKRGQHHKYRPYAFTEHGVAMLSSVLRSERAIRVNIEIIRIFVKQRRMVESHAGLVRKINALQRKYDEQFRVVFDAIRELMQPLKPRIGFQRP